MESLSYSQNQGAFWDLAYLVPYTSLGLNTEASPSHTTAQRIAKALLKTAGFSPPKKPSGTSLHQCPKAGDTSFALGQATTPAGGSRGLATYWPGNARKAFIADDPGGGPALIGRDRAGDMSVNVVLPFLHA
jgi:hypothetical protein